MELRELQKQEAIRRLEILEQVYHMHKDVLRAFKQDDGTVYYSERMNSYFDGILYWIKNKPEFVDVVKEIENQFNIYVYHCILSHTEYGDWLSMLYISDNQDDWVHEKSKLMIGLPKAYVYDFSGFESEFGTIQIEGANGGLTRLN